MLYSNKMLVWRCTAQLQSCETVEARNPSGAHVTLMAMWGSENNIF